MTTLVCLGLGYCARFYVAEFGSRFDRVIGTSRTPDKTTGGAVEMLIFDGVHPSPELRDADRGRDHLLISAAPGEAGDPVLAVLARRHRRRVEAAIDRLSVVARRLWRSRRRLDRRDHADHSAAHARRRARRRRTGVAGARPAAQHAGRDPAARRHLRSRPERVRRVCSPAAPIASTSRATSPTASMSPTSPRRSTPRSCGASTASSMSPTASPRRRATRSSSPQSCSASRRRRCFHSKRRSERCRRS